ncbi:MAG: hypothetical protein VB878_17685 [Pirellulaceae bacterium]
MKKRGPIDLSRLRVLPLAERESLTQADEILISPDSRLAKLPSHLTERIVECASSIRSARQRDASVILIYGAHLLRNGAARLVEQLLSNDWVTHLATNGAGTIHDWEYAWFGASTESVRMNVAQGQFGTWDETASNIHMALMVGALEGLGYGQALGRFICEDGATMPTTDELLEAIVCHPEDRWTSARADLLRAMRQQAWSPGRFRLNHRWKHASILAHAWRHQVPLTVHPGIGYDIISNHPVFSGSTIGRAGETDFKLFGGAVEDLDGGVVLSIGSAIMGPQVFEKSLSCVNNLRLQDGREIVRGLKTYVVDLQDGGGWNWADGEPPKTNPAYYLRFCKSYSRMGGKMHYLQCDNTTFVHNLLHQLAAP